MRLGPALMLGLVVALAGCGGSAEAGMGDAGMDAGMDSGLDAGTADAGTDGSTATDAGGTDAMTDATITLSAVSVYGNCMPVVAPDPIIAFWNVSVSGASSATATLVDAELTITGGGTTVNQTLTVDTPTVDLTGGAGSADQRKTGAEGDSSGACGTLCDGATYSLELTYEVDGAMVTVIDTGTYGCVY